MLEEDKKFPIIDIFGKKIKVKGYYCNQDDSNNGNSIIKNTPSLGLYVNINNICNAKCKFCNVHKNQLDINFDLEKFENVIQYLIKNKIIHKVAITGGETFLSFELINNIIDIIYKYSNHLMVTINTNGTFANKILELHHLNDLYAVLLSRHHYDDKINTEIFGCKTTTKELLIELNKKLPERLLRFKCTLMKGYIDNLEEVEKYLEFASEIGIKNVGFSVLRPENDFCKKNLVESMNYENISNVMHVYSHSDGDYCRCNNYIYTSKNFNSIGFYDRTVKKVNEEYCFQLLYNNNNLYAGFGKEMII